MSGYERIRITQLAIRCEIGLVVVAWLFGPTMTMYMISMRWDVGNCSREETQAFVKNLESAVIWLTSKENWDVPVGKFVEQLEPSKSQPSPVQVSCFLIIFCFFGVNHTQDNDRHRCRLPRKGALEQHLVSVRKKVGRGVEHNKPRCPVERFIDT
jgi:hypothetical protein